MKMHALFLRAITPPYPQFLTGNKLYSILKVSSVLYFKQFGMTIVRLFVLPFGQTSAAKLACLLGRKVSN